MKQAILSIGEIQPAPGLPPGRLESARAGARATLRLWRQRSLQRSRLATLSAHELDDIGMTEAERLAESAKPFWRV
jgi:uncharacterized protein YjiS (DUF1127 family)